MQVALFAWLIVCSLIGIVPFLLFAWHYDRFVRAAYRHDREFWKKIGEPRGFFWVPREKLLSFFAYGGMNDIPRGEAEARSLFGARDDLWILYTVADGAKRRAFLFGAVSTILLLVTMAVAFFAGGMKTS